MKTTRRNVLALVAGAAASGALPAGAQTGGELDDLRAGPNSADFDQVWELARDRFYDPTLHGLDWQAVKARYRPQAIAARSRDDSAVAINAMLSELGASHTHYYTPEDPAYYQLADIFVGALEHRGLDRAERAIVRRQDFIADQNAALMRRRALDCAGHECAAEGVDLGERPDPRIGDLALREHPLEAAMLERAHEDVGELIIGGILRCIIMRVGGAEVREHRIDHDRRFFSIVSGGGLRAVARAHGLPVKAVQARVVEAVAHEFPGFVERRLIWSGRNVVRLARDLSACRPGAERSRRKSQDIPARCFH